MMDADDVSAPERISKQMDYLRRHADVGVLGTQIDVIDADSQLIGHRRFPLLHDAILRALPRVVPLSQPSVMFRRELFKMRGGYQDAGYAAAEDYELWSRWIQQGVRFANHPETLLSYRLHASQTKFKYLRETIVADLRVKEKYWAASMGLRDRVWSRFQRLLHWLPEPLVSSLVRSILYRDLPFDAHGEGSRGEGRGR